MPYRAIVSAGKSQVLSVTMRTGNAHLASKNRLVTAILSNTVLPDLDQMGSNWLWDEHPNSERSVIIAIETVRHLTSTSVFLKVKGVVVAGFDDFDPISYLPAPEDWEAPYPYKHTDILFDGHTETA